MIPISTFNLLVVVDILFIVYAIIDHRNRLYANVVIVFLAGLLSAFIASAISSDAVYEVVGATATVVNSPSVGYFFYFVSTIAFAYTVFMAYEIIDEVLQQKKQAIASNNDEDGYE
jgi:predicted membrane protein